MCFLSNIRNSPGVLTSIFYFDFLKFSHFIEPPFLFAYLCILYFQKRLDLSQSDRATCHLSHFINKVHRVLYLTEVVTQVLPPHISFSVVNYQRQLFSWMLSRDSFLLVLNVESLHGPLVGYSYLHSLKGWWAFLACSWQVYRVWRLALYLSFVHLLEVRNPLSDFSLRRFSIADGLNFSLEKSCLL